VSEGVDDPGGMDHGRYLEGRYANYFEVAHNAFEFVLDCGQIYGPEGLPHFHTRLVIIPTHMAELVGLLGRSVAQYESTIARIRREGSA
jgi:hypothetical protein